MYSVKASSHSSPLLILSISISEGYSISSNEDIEMSKVKEAALGLTTCCQQKSYTQALTCQSSAPGSLPNLSHRHCLQSQVPSGTHLPAQSSAAQQGSGTCLEPHSSQAPEHSLCPVLPHDGPGLQGQVSVASPRVRAAQAAAELRNEEQRNRPHLDP